MSSTQQEKDHRRMKRRLAKMTTSVLCRQGSLGLGPNRALRVVDVSVDGVCILVSVALNKGDLIEVTLTPSGVGRPIVRSAVVAWCSAQEGNKYEIGAKFQTPLTYTDVFYMT